MIIVPAVLTLFGDRAWWYPGWLDRITPNVDIEGVDLLHNLEDAEHETSSSDEGGAEDTDEDQVLIDA